YLSSGYQGQLGGYRDSVDFAASEREVPLGRYLKSTGGSDFTAMSQPTPGQANAYPLVGPVVISEIMYAPVLDGDEYIELANLTNSAIPLYDPSHPQNTWKFTAGLSYIFPSLASIPALGYALVVNIDPSLFRSKYHVPDSVPIYGPYTGALNNAGEKLELSRPGDPELNGTVPYYPVDRVNYDRAAPWPVLPNATGPSLARVNLTAYGNDSGNWTSEKTGGSPGLANFDRIAPGVTINLPIVSPNPGPIEQLTFQFSEPVMGFDLADLILRRYGEVIPWRTNTSISSVDGWNWVLSGLEELTQEAGTYSLTLVANDSNIMDLSGNALVGDASVAFTNSRLVMSSPADSLSRLKVNGTQLQIYRPGQIVQSMLLSDLRQLDLSGGTIRIEGQLATVGESFSVQIHGDIANPTAVLLSEPQQWASLTLSGMASLSLVQNSDKPLRLFALNMDSEAILDLGTNDLIVTATPETKVAVLAALSNAIKSARGADGQWLGNGLTSFVAQTSTQTCLAIMLNEKDGKPILGTFAGQSVGTNDILVKYTWNGDVTFDGKVNGDDYFLIDSGFLTRSHGYRNGDINYDGVIDGDDYFLVDSAFITQSSPAIALASADSLLLSQPNVAKDTTRIESPLAQLFSTTPLLA
ncbi:MAG: hypothetical protein ACM359_24740, partial [Bacillota bacterium]